MCFQHQKQVAKAILALTTLVVLSAYVVTYVRLRDRGVREFKQYNSDRFLYDSADRVLQTHDMSTHEFRFWVFAPLNFVDRTFFNGPDPIRCLMFDLL